MAWSWPWSVKVSESVMDNRVNPAPSAPYSPPYVNSGEFSFSPFAYIQRTVGSASANVSRLFSSSTSPALQQAEPSGPAWYNIPARLSASANAVGEGIQSTLVKVIILVSIVGVIAVFGMSYMQAKGANLAK